ncbi:MAG: SpoIIE family protein phosphatase [Rhodopirellula sp.]|nr:SpoIIE family protein phosphatase [Rhodopirellula sp.]
MLLFLLIAVDYQQETGRRLTSAQIGLQEEAAILEVGVRQLRNLGTDALQRLLDQVCLRMEETHSAGHHLVLRIGDLALQAQSTGLNAADMLNAIDSADSTGEYIIPAGDHRLIIGVSKRGDVSVYICEIIDDLHDEIVGDSLRRLGGTVTLGLIATLILNVTLLRIVARPLERLVGQVDEISAGQFGQEINGFRSRELSHLSHAINEMSRSLAESDRQRQAQLAKARRIQQHLQPSDPVFGNARFAVCYEPAEEVAGDLYDVLSLPDGSSLAVLADATGHGIPAAMTATLLKALLAEACERFCDLLEIVSHVNGRFTELTLPGDFASAILIRLPPDKSTIQVINAGHDAALFSSRDGALRECQSSGLLLGITDESRWSVEEVAIGTGDRLLMFTDGVTETFDVSRRMFGRDRVQKILETSMALPPEQILATIASSLVSFRGDAPQADDVTMILIEF